MEIMFFWKTTTVIFEYGSVEILSIMVVEIINLNDHLEHTEKHHAFPINYYTVVILFAGKRTEVRAEVQC